MNEYDFYKHHDDVIAYVRANYSDWNDIPEADMCVCDNGLVIVGMTEFQTPHKIEAYEL